MPKLALTRRYISDWNPPLPPKYLDKIYNTRYRIGLYFNSMIPKCRLNCLCRLFQILTVVIRPLTTIASQPSQPSNRQNPNILIDKPPKTNNLHPTLP